MKALLIGGPQHGKTLDVRDDAYEVVFPNYGSMRAHFSRIGFDSPRASSLCETLPTTIRYRRENFGLALALGSRLKVEVFVCTADVSMKTAESYMVDVLAAGLKREIDSREVAR